MTNFNYLSCSHLRGVGKAILEKLARLEIFTIQDLLFHLPSRYEDRTQISPISHLRDGNKALIEGTVATVSFPTSGKTRLLCELQDSTRRLHIRFFHVYPSHKKMLAIGTQLRCFGEARLGPTGLEMAHPELLMITNETQPLAQHLTPIYPTTEGLSQNMWRKLMQQALTLLTNDAFMKELLPSSLSEPRALASVTGVTSITDKTPTTLANARGSDNPTQNSPTFHEALLFVHSPPKDASIATLEERSHATQKRLAFEELLAHRLGLLRLKQSLQHYPAITFTSSDNKTSSFLQSLPFNLTAAQNRVVEEITKDLQQSHPMLRLVQGDVGSGKTVVAALAVLKAVENGCQSAVMAPTELLAEQHYRVFKQWFEPLGLQVVFLSGQMKAKERRDAVEAISDGRAHLALGTHALFQKDIVFSKLALVVIDEQHRFGVHQRALFREKGISDHHIPHQLIMTATPIPRTLAMSIYADLDCSVIDEMPKGRLPVRTSVVPGNRREEVIAHVREACQTGRQAYWVCPLIEESEILECQAAETTAKLFQQILSGIKVGLLHGRMKAADKDQTMQAFKEQKIQLLVATTVIEVGVDVPNASLMIIENSERLGLSQLHQLRGRVGRGAVESHCVLLYQLPLSSFANKRLAAMRSTQDGFKIAEHDLALRGPGDVLGTRQTGDITFRVADLMRDSELLPQITETAAKLMQEHPEVIDNLIERWIRNGHQYTHV